MILNHLSSFYHIAMSPVALEPSSLNWSSEHSSVIVIVYIHEILKNHLFIQQYFLNTYHVFITVVGIVATAVDKTDQKIAHACPHGIQPRGREDQKVSSKFCAMLAGQSCDGEKQGRKQDRECPSPSLGFMGHRPAS